MDLHIIPHDPVLKHERVTAVAKLGDRSQIFVEDGKEGQHRVIKL